MWHNYQQMQTLENPVDLKKHITNILEKKVQESPHIYNDQKDAEMKIVQISFAYNNGEVIKLLTKRGRLIASGKYNKIEAVEEQINKLMEENEKD